VKPAPQRLIRGGLYALFLGSIAWFTYTGLPYYLTPLAERPRHPLYWQLKPGGTWGLAFGIIGAAMMIVMLLYSVRKRFVALRRLGPVADWLDFHILLGLCGPLFILLHSSFKVQGLVALSFWSMVAVATSGIAGRYLYRQIPHSSAGDELSLAEVEKLDQDLARRLMEEVGLDADAIGQLDAVAALGTGANRSLTALALRFPLDSLQLRLRLRRFRKEFPPVDRHLRRRYELLVKHKVSLRRRILLWQRVRELFHYWHVFHKPFAVVMYLFMMVHIGVAWMTGYARIGH
jgi:8-oxo-dGTP pyrophosphatase MutT (NUDIX family)